MSSAHAAYWASWVDALHMVGMMNPTVADAVVESMSSHEELVEECLGGLRRATDRLDSEGFWSRPIGPTFELEVGQANLESGDTVGNIGLLPFLTRTSGRGPRACVARWR